MSDILCCYMMVEGRCTEPAAFTIYDDNDRSPSQATESCEAHVGALLGSVPPVEPTGPWTVVALDEKEAH